MRILVHLYFPLFLALFFNSSLLAQKPGFIFHHLTLNDGLSESTVRCITEDKKGFMWFGSEDGLNKYDGYKFTVYKNNPADKFSLSNNHNKAFLISSTGNLWIATRGGLNFYDQVKDRFYNCKSGQKGLAPLSSDIESMAEDENGNIWVAAYSDGLYRIESLDKAPDKFIFSSGDNAQLFGSLMPDKNGNLWIGTMDGLLKFDIKEKKFTDLRSKYGRGYQVRNIFIDEQKNVWLATTTGVKIINGKTGEMQEYFHDKKNPNGLNGNNVLDIIPHKNGNFLIAIDGAGMDYFDVKNEKFYHYTEDDESQIACNNVISLFKDSKGDIWAGTFLNGINFSNSTTNHFALIKNNPYSDKSIRKGIVTCFLKDRKDNLWITTDGGGLYQKKKGTNIFIHYSASQGVFGLSSDNVVSLFEDEEGMLWLTTYGGGLIRFNPANNSFKTYTYNPEDKFSICNDKIKDVCLYKNEMWACGYGTGISVLDRTSGKFRHYRHDKFDRHSLPSDWIHYLFVDSYGTLWIGTFKGLAKYLPETNNFQGYLFDREQDSSNDKNFIYEIFEDSQRNFWVGTSSGGLILFDRDKEDYKIFTTKDGLSNNCIKSIIEDNNSNLWLANINGVTKFNINTKKGKPYTIQDGIPPSSFYYNSKYKDEEGRIYFGANDGYLVIDPSMSLENKNIAPIVITELKIFNLPVYPGSKDSPLSKQISETEEIILPYYHNSLSLEFSALNFNNPQRNNYAYILEGFDRAWNFSGNRKNVTYTNLNPGTYIFRVKGSNNDNIWNEKGTFLKIIIRPPFWKTWWFTIIAAVSSVMFLYIMYRWRTKNIHKKNILLEEIIRKRTKELKETNEQLEAFVYKASHDIKGPLKSIIGLTTIGQKDVGDPVALNYFAHILKSTKKLDVLLMDLLEITKVKQATVEIQKIDFNELVKEALSGFEHMHGYEKMKFNINVKESADFLSDKKLLYSVIQNLIENPIKYSDPSKAESYLNISITVSEKGADLIFADNGVGIPESLQAKVFDMFFKAVESSDGTGLGLYIVKTTVEKLNGSIHLESELGKGSTFYVKF